MEKLTLIPCLLLYFVPSSYSHGRLIEPPSRASAWRYGFDTPHNYNDHELYCGGFSRQWIVNGGKCGVCGDAWDLKQPRPHEYGGVYGQGVVVRQYSPGSVINIRVELTANHNGYFVFSLCPDFRTTSQHCLDKYLLSLAKPQPEVEKNYFKFFPKEGNKVYEIKYKLPKMSCKHCVLQWRYIAGNNWGDCLNGTEAIGCGPQEEFRACADIAITGKNVPEMSPSLETTPPTILVSTSQSITSTTGVDSAEHPLSEETYNPFVAIVISVITFLVVSLILFLLYIHYYQIGGNVKKWIKGENPSDNLSRNSNKIEEEIRTNTTSTECQFPTTSMKNKTGWTSVFIPK